MSIINTHEYETAMHDVMVLGQAELGQFRILQDQNGLPGLPSVGLEVARLNVAAAIGAGTNPPPSEIVRAHADAFVDPQPPEVFGSEANIKTIRDAVSVEVDLTAMLLLDKYGIDEVRVPSHKALSVFVVRAAHCEDAEKLRAEEKAPNGLIARQTLLRAVALIEPVTLN